MGTLELTSGHFHLLAHTADIGLEASAPSRKELFITAANGLRFMLFGISPSDPVTVAGVLGIVLLVATVAALIPAARAALAQPAQALRSE